MKRFKLLMVSLCVFLLIVGFAIPAIAEIDSIKWYGQVSFHTWWDGSSKEASVGGQYSDQDFDMWLSSITTRLGVKFEHEKIGAVVELRSNNKSFYRHWYVSYDLDWTKLIIGHTWTPTFSPCSRDSNLHAEAYGDLGGSLRQPQISLQGRNYKLSLIRPNTISVGVPGTTEFDAMFPRIEAYYKIKAGPVDIKLTGGYNRFEQVDVNTDKGYGVQSCILGTNLKTKLGPVNLSTSVMREWNPKEYGRWGSSAMSAAYDAGTDSILDVDSFGYYINASMPINNTIGVSLGYGYVKHTQDVPGQDATEDKERAYYINFPIKIAKNFSIIPEFGINDHMDIRSNGLSTDEGYDWHIGALWKVKF